MASSEDLGNDPVLTEAKEAFDLAVEYESLNRRDALDDLRFSRLSEQWPPQVKRDRERAGRPCLTINRLPAFIRQVVNDARQNQPSIKIHPANSDADVHTAEVFNGLIRNIEVTSKADVAYDTALDYAVTMGWGYWRVNTQYAHDDSFDLDIRIERIPNPFSVYGDPFGTEADSSDWNSCFVTDLIDKESFRKKYKDAKETDWDANNGYDRLKDPWIQDNRLLIAEYFTRSPSPRTILLLSTGAVVDEKDYEAGKDIFDALGVTVITDRESPGYKVKQRVMSGAEVLEENAWAGQYIPIVPVYGEELNIEGKRHFRSLIRDAKEPQRMFNYWRTATTELVALAPKAPWVGRKGQFTTDQAKWETANVENHAFLEYDEPDKTKTFGPPQRQAFSGVPAGALQEAMNAGDDIKTVIGLYNASLGDQGNEISGRAILARQREGDVSTFHLIDNLSRAIEHCGRILIDLIPKVYTGQRIVRVLSPEGIGQNIQLNQPVQIQQQDGQILQHVYDLSRGKYDLTVEAGPSFTTRREETANQIIELIRAYPPAAPVLGDILAKNLDWPGADIIAQRLQALLPPAIQQMNGNGQGQQQQQAQNAQAAAAQAANGLKQQQINLQAADQQQSATMDQARLQLDMFKAQTERMRAEADIRQQENAMRQGIRAA